MLNFEHNMVQMEGFLLPSLEVPSHMTAILEAENRKTMR